MIISELVDQIVEETGRYDQEQLIAQQVRSCVLQLHAKAHFKRDALEEVITVPSPGPLVRLTLPPRMRSIVNLAITDQYGQPLYGDSKETSPTILLDESGRVPTKPYHYVNGATLTVSSGSLKTTVSYVYLNYIQSPDISDLGAETWLTQLYPEAVLTYVAYKVHSRNGNDTKAKLAASLFRETLNDLLGDQEAY